jgi:hypothetical protein
MADYTPKLELQFLVEGQSGAEAWHNEALLRAEFAACPELLDRGINSPPGSPSDGDAYLIGSSPTGDWATQANKLTLYASAWKFLTPKNGMRFLVKDESLWIAYDETEAEWYAFGTGNPWPATATWMGWKTPSGNKVYRKAWRNLTAPDNGTPAEQVHGLTIDFADDLRLTGSLRVPTFNQCYPLPQVTDGLQLVDLGITNTKIVCVSNFNWSPLGGKVDFYLEYTQ